MARARLRIKRRWPLDCPTWCFGGRLQDPMRLRPPEEVHSTCLSSHRFGLCSSLGESPLGGQDGGSAKQGHPRREATDARGIYGGGNRMFVVGPEASDGSTFRRVYGVRCTVQSRGPDLGCVHLTFPKCMLPSFAPFIRCGRPRQQHHQPCNLLVASPRAPNQERRSTPLPQGKRGPGQRPAWNLTPLTTDTTRQCITQQRVALAACFGAFGADTRTSLWHAPLNGPNHISINAPPDFHRPHAYHQHRLPHPSRILSLTSRLLDFTLLAFYGRLRRGPPRDRTCFPSSQIRQIRQR